MEEKGSSEGSDDMLIAGPVQKRGGFSVEEVDHRKFRMVYQEEDGESKPGESLQRTPSLPVNPVGDANLMEGTSKESFDAKEVLKQLKESMGTVLTHKKKALDKVVKEAARPSRPKLRRRSVPSSTSLPRGMPLDRWVSAPESTETQLIEYDSDLEEDDDLRYSLNLDERVLTTLNKVKHVEAETTNVSQEDKPGLKALPNLRVDTNSTMTPGSMTATPPGSLSMPLIEFDDLKQVKPMGKGQFATVYLCTWRGVCVAVKEHHGCDETTLTNSLKEAETLAALRHPCVLAFYGVVTNGPFPSQVMEFMVHGSLKDKLTELRGKGISGMKLKASIALQAARGMDFLHRRKIIHFDLKCANLLCDLQQLDAPIVKIGDVGLSKEKLQSFVSGNMRGTLPWMAPELIPSAGSAGGSIVGQVNEMVDVYSFGVVLWEIWTMGMDPYPNTDTTDLLFAIMSRTLKLEIPPDCDEDWAALIEHCTEIDSEMRPTFEAIATTLEGILDRVSGESSTCSDNFGYPISNRVEYASTSSRDFHTAQTNQYFSAENTIV